MTQPEIPHRIPYEVWLKLHSRPMYFLSEEHIVLLKGEELKWYIRKAWYWLVVNQHVGPFWLTAVVRALFSEPLSYPQYDVTPADEMPVDLRELVEILKKRMEL